MNYDRIKEENRRKICEYIPGSDGGKVAFYPAYIQLEQTSRCNGQCIMCNHFFLGNNGAKDIEPGVIERMKQVFPYCETLMLNGDGEPFFAEHIIENVRLYKSYGMKIGTNTNLSFMPDLMWNLLRDGFDFLNISCDGVTKQVFELIRRGLSYERFMDNLAKLKERAPNLRKNMDCVLMRENINEIVEIVELAAKWDFVSVRFHRMGVNPCIGNYHDSDEEFEKYAASRVLLAKKRADELGIRIEIPDFSYIDTPLETLDVDYKSLLLDINNRQKSAEEKFGDLSLSTDYFSSQVTDEDLTVGIWNAGKPCQWAIERCYVDLSGNVSTCCYNVRKKMGNLLVNSFDDIWNGREYRQLRTMMAKDQLPAFCRDCNWIKEGRF